MASRRANLAVIVGSTATLAASWAGIVAADTHQDDAESAQLPIATDTPDPEPSSTASITLAPLPVAPIAPLQIPDAPTTDLSSLTRVEAQPIAPPQITLPSMANLVPAPTSSTATVVRKSKAS